MDSQFDALQRQVQAQKAQIDQQGKELEAMRQQQGSGGAQPAPGSCDDAVMRKAIAHGDEQYAAGNLKLALGYYQDATVACPGNAQAEIHVARVYEKMGDREQAASYYRRARDSAGSADSPTAAQAREGLARVGRSQ